MKRKFLILICLILFIVSVAAVSAAESDANQTDDLKLSLDNNPKDNAQEVNLGNSNELQENGDSSEKLTDSNVLAAPDEDKLAGKTITVESLTFNAIQTAIDSAEAGDTISLKEGTYLNNGNGQIFISKNNISIVGVKDSTILDAQKTSRIFNIASTSGITIKDIVFMNGKDNNGGAIYFNSAIENFNIDAAFINNTARLNGGANYFEGVSNSNISGTYNNNKATEDGGGANYFHEDVSNSTISGTYNNNTATEYGGGANYFSSTVSNSTISGTYSNNTARRNGGANYFEGVSNSNISGTYSNNTANDGGGANYFNNVVSNSTISGTYINNKADIGGANYFSSTVSNSTISGNYSNNKADTGGANRFWGTVSNSTISGNYSNNTARLNGGANYFEGVSNSTISGTYNNNTATNYGGANIFNIVSNSTISGTYNNNKATAYSGGANTFTIVSNSTISGTYNNNKATNGTLYIRSGNARIINAIFVNNDCSYVIYAKNPGVVANNNWFGNNATNYNEKPETHNVEMTSWLFLNATADPSEIGVAKSSKIRFVLQSYNGTSGSVPNINLTLSQTLGELDKTSASVGEEITYTNKKAGNATITGKFETASYTLTVKASINDASVSVANSTLNLRIGDTYTINATTLPAGLNVTYLPDNSGIISVDENGKITALKEGTAGIIVKVGGDDIYAENSTVVTVTVSKIPTEIAAPAVSTVYNVDKNLIVTLKDANGKPISGVDITVNLNGDKKYTTDANGQIKVTTKGFAPKTYTATITFGGNANYTQSQASAKVTVKKATPKLTAKKKTFKKSKKVKKYSVTLKTNTNKALKKVKLTLKIKGKTYKATTNAKGKATFKIKKLTKKGTYKAKVTFKGNKYYNKVTKKVKIKIK